MTRTTPESFPIFTQFRILVWRFLVKEKGFSLLFNGQVLNFHLNMVRNDVSKVSTTPLLAELKPTYTLNTHYIIPHEHHLYFTEYRQEPFIRKGHEPRNKVEVLFQELLYRYNTVIYY